ncbi:TerB family tellurite resistance protein [Profundibacterium mesophilum]|uniref:Co-chaperone DjlA N-terminal domain-containing protein n=1 Tax=Profundibacterium mesophilum KAUST100406-0324 TaxID=1037889 RepID=A0A921NPV2_9RHOB|nr:TerB family tellurite resistance protein [Profundibacterium mesophilum]KAF0675787.1 uncharacterized protein PMES_01873 [Profundibacterium mesophilum KAUST100406-0324]
MIAEFIKRLTAPDPAPFADADARLALAALLVRIARADGVYAPEERGRIDRVLAARYGLASGDAAELRAQAEGVEAEAPDTVRFTRAIKDAVSYEERLQVIEALWEIVLADGTRDDEEDALLRMLAPMLGVSDRDSNLARQSVEKRRQ